MKKLSIFLLLMALFAPLAMNAQSTLSMTVYENETATNARIPLYGYNGDYYQKTEFVIPASELTALNGKTITQMAFYISGTAPTKVWGPFQVFLKEVDFTTISAWQGDSGATTVYTGTFDGTSGTVNVIFNGNTPTYTYNGGNLLVGVYLTTTSGNWNSANFYGKNVDGASGNGDNNNSLEGCTFTQRNFVPRTTFTYLTSDPSIALNPTSATVVTGFTQTLTASTFNVTGTPTITYTSSNTNVATVTGSGTSATVTAVAPGTATITATMNYQGTNYTATCDITVEDPHACTPELTGTYTSYYISNFTTTGATTNINNTTSGTGLSYSDYYNSYSASAYEGQTINFTITIAGGSTHGSAIWVDWNDDLEFSDNERVHQTSGYTSSPHTGSFTVPTGATLGDHRMRIVTDYYGGQPSNPCSASTGEFEDYKLTVISQPSCMTPTSLAVTTDGATATATWTGTANTYNVEINGTPSPNNPITGTSHTFNVDLSTTYTVRVQANCDGGETSEWTDPVSVTTPPCVGGRTINYTLNDSYGDGWNGASISVYEGCGTLLDALTVSSGSSNSGTLTICSDYVEFIWNSGSYDSECSFTFTEGGTTLFTKPNSLSDGMTIYTIGNQSCAKPTGLAESNITINSADLSWTGSSSSYMVEYTPWNPAGNDTLPTATMSTYTFPLNGTGTGSVVIRHYDVTNMFRLIVDDIVVKDANGNTIYSQNFETSGGTMPAEFTSIDMDGDGYGWEVVSSDQSYVNGSYGLSSASWNSTAGALFPDNWIILSGIQLGGSISFQARGQDPSFPAEKFCVYVCADADAQQEPAASTSYTLGSVNPLTPFTPYSWNVKGICGTDESCPSFTNIFITLDDVIVFTTQGNWNDASNWDLNRVPTGDDKVRLDADATIGNGVVAYAKKIVNASTGTVTILDGGQLKQSETAVVTIKKTIAPVGTTNWNADDNSGYYFIATPLTTTLFSQQTDWAYVDITSSGTYDLYSFDPSQELEWINYNNSENSGDDFDRLFNGQGYLYANRDGYTLSFEGSTAVASLNNVITQDFAYTAGGFNGWKLVGNPFTCNAYLSYVDNNNDVLSADFYTMNNSNTYTLLTSSDALTPCSGAFVSVNATGKIQFSSEAPTGNKTGMININLVKGNNTVDQARVRFGEGFNLEHKSFRNNSKVYMPVDNNDYAVVYAENQGEQPVSLKAEENGTYTLSFNTENVSFGYLHLIDNLTGNDVDLLSTPSYSFEAKTTDYANRFKLVFATGNADDNFAFFNNGSFVINNEGNATLQVMDVTGRMISSETINGCANVNVNAAPGVYMIRLINGENVKVQKVVVR